jgi:broad specificity phosphatase PhoE
MAQKVHLVRHGEVENPDHIVYADLQEFGLSATGVAQVRETASYLSSRPIGAVCSSPLTRAMETAAVIASLHQIEVDIVDELTEFGLSTRWRGRRWEELDDCFPGEVDAYLDHPENLPFSSESLEAMADRMEVAIRSLGKAHPGAEVVVVSHQDPIQAARLAMTGRPLSSFWEAKPEHAEVITLQPGTPWREIANWGPPIESGQFPPGTRDSNS